MSFRAIFCPLIPRILYNFPRQYHKVNTMTIPQPNLTFLINKRFKSKTALKCWQCGIERTNIGDLFCEKCSFIQTPHEKDNYFKIFEIDENFDIDQKQLTQKYRRLQSQLHPDKFSNKSDEEKNISDEFSALVNKAYQTLQTPLKRAIHLLHLRGTAIEEGQKIEDPEFLLEIMELNEEVENANSDEKLINLKRKNELELAKIGQEIKSLFDCNQIAKAKDTIIKMKYYNSVNNHINDLMREKGIVE